MIKPTHFEDFVSWVTMDAGSHNRGQSGAVGLQNHQKSRSSPAMIFSAMQSSGSRQTCLSLLLTLIILSCQPPVREEMETPIDEVMNSSLDRAIRQYKQMHKVLPDTLFPRSLDKNDQLVTNQRQWWTSGFFPGSLWYLYEYSGDESIKQMALDRTATLEKEQYNNMDHDIGFKMLCSYGNGIRITGDSSATPILIQSAASLISRFRETTGVIKSWEGFREYKYPVIIDNMMNLELLFWASKVSGDPKYRKVAIRHADVTLANHFRPDNSSYHVLAYDSLTGEVLAKKTAQGAADGSAWARGQAWGLYGYVMTHRETKDNKYLRQAEKIANFILDHPNKPEDHIPYWDFNAPGIPDALRDASAAAITASALIELSGYVNKELKNKYLKAAEIMIISLSGEDYLAREGKNGHFILMHGVGHKPGNSEIDVPLSYADYYFIEAMMRFRKTKTVIPLNSIPYLLYRFLARLLLQPARIFQPCEHTMHKVLRTFVSHDLVSVHGLCLHRPSQKLHFLAFLVLTSFSYFPALTQTNPDWKPLTERYTREQLHAMLESPDTWKLYPKATNRQAWEKVPQYMKDRWIKRGEEALSYEWTALPATLFLDYARTGNRQPYSSKLYERRIKMRQLVLAECMENKGRFIDQIINAIWLICEETFWGIPAHIGMQKAGMGLPDAGEPVVDLFAAETSEMLAWSVYLLREQLDEVSPLVYQRVKLEARCRILHPTLTRDDFWWMGLNKDPKREKVGNWNPWIASNWMATAILLIEDKENLIDHISKILKVLDAYVSKNPADGASDEGPHYWGHAAGSLLDALELLYGATNGKFNIYDDPLITQMGQYLNRMHINEQYYFNYADAVPYIRNNAFLIYHYGYRINDPSLMDLGAYLVPFGDYKERAGTHDGMGRVLREIFLVEELQASSQEHLFLRDVWMPVSQLMTARQKAGSAQGFFLGAKAGHNAEGQGHNHNDVGNFIVYYNGKPVIIDVGMASYNSKTFSPKRYEIWNNQSAYHNLPTINGIMQHNGREFRAKNVNHSADKRRATLSMDISGAYPPEAGLETWNRVLTLDRKKGITLSDTYKLNGTNGKIQLSLMTICKVDTSTPGQLVFQTDTESGKDVMMTYDAEKLSVAQEQLPFNTKHDPRIKQYWGEYMVRILFSTKNEIQEDNLVFQISDR